MNPILNDFLRKITRDWNLYVYTMLALAGFAANSLGKITDAGLSSYLVVIAVLLPPRHQQPPNSPAAPRKPARSSLALLLLAPAVLLLLGCNRPLLRRIDRNVSVLSGQLSRIDSTYRTHQTQLLRYEKGRINDAYRNISDPELELRIRHILRSDNQH